MTQITNGKGGGAPNKRAAEAGNDNRRDAPFVDDVFQCVVCRSDMVRLVPCAGEKR